MSDTYQRESRHRPRIALLIVVALALVATGCGKSKPAVSSEFTPTFADLDNRIKIAEENIKTQENAFKEAVKASDDVIKGLSATDQHADRIDQAKVKLKEVKALMGKETRPLAVSFQEVSRVALEQSLETLNQGLANVDRLANDPVAWLNLLNVAQSDPASLKAEASASADTVVDRHDQISPRADKVMADYPHQAAYISGIMADLATKRDVVTSNAVGIRSAGNADIVKLGTYSLAAKEGALALKAAADEFESDLETLSSSKTITLLDIKVIFVVTMSRSSWNSWSDFGEQDESWGPREVGLATGDQLAGVDGESEVKPGDYPELAQVFPELTQGIPGDHDSVEYFVADWDEVICHKVRELVDGQPATTERPTEADPCSKYDTEAELADGVYWTEADGINSAAIGMDIFSKAAGDFDDQASEIATPPGMIYVGDANYGEWQKDNNGNDFWVFYGRYRFFSDLIGGPYSGHYRHEYDTWNRDYRRQEKPFYAPTNGVDRFGANSPMVGSRFPNSSYTKDGLAQATVRNSGAVARAGGPGGGGK